MSTARAQSRYCIHLHAMHSSGRQAVSQTVPHPCQSVAVQPGLKDSRPNAAGEVVSAVNGLKRVISIILLARTGGGWG